MKIHLRGKARTREIWLNGKELKPWRSLKVRNHSPTGFNYGYNGSGPAQLALAVCLEIYPEGIARRIYQIFKEEYIATLPCAQDFDRKITVWNEEEAERIVNS
jgi:hypothetical protein